MNGIPNNEDFEQQLINLASDRPEIYKSANSWFIKQGSKITPILVEGLSNDRLGSICHWRILILLQYFAKEETLPAIIKILHIAIKQHNSITIHGAMEALSVFCAPSATKTLIRALHEANLDIVKQAAVLLGRKGDLSAIEPLLNLLKSSDPSLRFSAIRGLIQLDSPIASNYLIQHLQTETDSENQLLIMSGASSNTL